MRRYDYIITGAGCAGLSLAYYLSKSSLQEKSILLVDKSTKIVNDRTWCFWEKETNPFEHLVHHSWNKIDFYGTDFGTTLDLEEYKYKMIRGLDFYQFVQQHLESYKNIHVIYQPVTDISETIHGAIVTTDVATYQADYVFNSIYSPDSQPKKQGYHYLLQHFKGWEIETPSNFFDPQKATLMDFRIEQKGEARFFYVLPLDQRRALIEFTVFSDHLLLSDIYSTEIQAYIQNYLHLTHYKIVHEEFGVIPMTDHPFPASSGKRIFNIGTAGGQTKASTGYTFLRIQQKTQDIVESIQQTDKPCVKSTSPIRFSLYDSLLLNIMAKKRYAIKDIFTLLFQKNKASTILRFLDEQTTFSQDLKIMSTTPYRPFLAALSDIILHR